ncbi:GNAT family N-acetyltransferase [uncultured Zoogloea sp.]|uniref:GNAT family N-acetyltransferase n=1 Tax=uncultured Zoogloea sp. TaxID=160237 RepID=UPI002622EC78|nr:GNAT family N-acetyltransferase [uncultured Zoogloea sp.]
MSAALAVRLGSWDELSAQASPIRFTVFVDEQKVPVELELDEFDPLSCHALALAGDEAVGTGRLLPDGHIGRMAVLAGWRGRGVGALLLQALIDEAKRRGMARVVLNAQTHALGFYARFGFVPEGEEYEEAGLPHRTMGRSL